MWDQISDVIAHLNWGDGWVWTARCGLGFEFFSFFLVAPEVLGEGRLAEIAHKVRHLSAKLSNGVAARSRRQRYILAIGTGLILLYQFGHILTHIANHVVITTPATGETNWNFILWLVGFYAIFLTPFLIMRFIQVRLPILTERLVENANARERLLATGATLFIVGILFQLAATFEPK